jgi:hypothetical protein
MSGEATRIRQRDDKLLKREPYLKRNKRIAFWMVLFFLALSTTTSMGALPFLPNKAVAAASFLFAFYFILLAYESHLSLRHVDSIKMYREVYRQIEEC